MQIESEQVIKIFLLTFINYVSNILALKIDKTIKNNKVNVTYLIAICKKYKSQGGEYKSGSGNDTFEIFRRVP